MPVPAGHRILINNNRVDGTTIRMGIYEMIVASGFILGISHPRVGHSKATEICLFISI